MVQFNLLFGNPEQSLGYFKWFVDPNIKPLISLNKQTLNTSYYGKNVAKKEYIFLSEFYCFRKSATSEKFVILNWTELKGALHQNKATLGWTLFEGPSCQKNTLLKVFLESKKNVIFLAEKFCFIVCLKKGLFYC